MNERIKQLAEQATSIVEMVGPQDYASSYANFDREKFAELIVQECLMKAIGAKIRGESIDTLIQNIKEDFGVEE
jgi:hypothetical protein